MKSQRHAGVGSRQHAAVPFPPDGGGAGGVLAITWTSGRPTGLSSANTGSHAASAAKLTALSKPRAIIRGRNTVARPPPPTSARIPNPEESRTITRFDFRTSIAACLVKSSNPHENGDRCDNGDTQAELAFEEEWRFHPPGRA